MSFKTLKTLLIVLLCAVDLFLGGMLYSQQRALTRIDGEVIGNAVELLGKGGIAVSAEELSKTGGELGVLDLQGCGVEEVSHDIGLSDAVHRVAWGVAGHADGLHAVEG